MNEDFLAYSGAHDLESEMDLIEIGVAILDGDVDAGYDEFGVMNIATAKNYERLLKKLKKLKAAAKDADGGKKRRLERRIKRTQRRLANIKSKKGRQIKRRKGKGKELTKRQQKFADARKSRKARVKAARQKKRIAKARSAAIKRGWPSDLTITDKWLNNRKVKSKAFFIVAAYVTYTRAAIVMAKQGLSFIQAFRQVLPKIRKSSYRQEVSLALRPYLGKLTIAAKEYVAKEKGEEATTEDGAPIRRIRRVLPARIPATARLAPVYRTRPGLDMRARLQALRAQRAQAAAAQVAEQRAAAARQAELMRQQQAAMAAQQQAQAAALARQRAALAAQLAAQRAAFQRQMQQTAAQERVIQSGAFQAFPHSSPISGDQEVEDTSLDMDMDMDMDEGDDFDEEGDEEGEDFGEDEFGEAEESTPLYKNPLVLVGAAAVALFGYQKMQSKKKGKKSKPGAPAAG